MPAELDYREDGSAAVFTTRKPAWHREGEVYDEPPTLDEAIERYFDWYVRMLPLQAIGEGDNVPADLNPLRGRVRIDVPDRFAVVRMDRGNVLGVVGSRYSTLQNHEAFQPLRPLVESGVADIETGGVLREGEDVWMLVRLNMEEIANRVEGSVEEIFAAGDDQVIPYMLVTNNHAGRKGVEVRETPIKVVCANTLSMALSGQGRAIKVRHTGDVASKVQTESERLFTSVINRYEILAQSYRLLRSTRLTDQQFERLVLDPVAPLKDEDELETKRAETYQQKRVAKRDEITDYWTNGSGHRGDQSAWEAYNGLVEALDHSDRWQPRSLTRVESMVGGTINKLKDRVGRKLIQHAKRN